MGTGVRRAVVEAYDRLAERLLQRLRVVHEDVDAGLAEVRSDVAALRQTVDDLGDRMQLRQLKASVDELRSDVAGLRRAVLEWPELERVSGDITSLRADMSEITAQLTTLGERPSPPPLASLAPLVEELAALRAELSAAQTSDAVVEELAALRAELRSLAPASSPDLLGDAVLDELAEVRAELVSLRRRISLRASD